MRYAVVMAMTRPGNTVYVGSYTAPSGGGLGIARFARDAATGLLTDLEQVTPTTSPSFLTLHPTLPVLYCVSEVDEADGGAVRAFRRTAEDTLEPLGGGSTGGAAPCHLAVDATGGFLLAANFTSGSVSVHRLDSDGRIGARTDLHQQEGSGPVQPQWQAGPHAHEIVVAADGAITVPDLGADRLVGYRLDTESGRLRPEDTGTVATPPGDGPRHLVRHPDGFVYVANQLGGTVAVYAPTTGGGFEHVTALPVAPPDAPAGDGPAEIVLAPDARTLYVSHRGADLVAVFGVDGPALRPLAQVPSEGRYPRHIALVGGYLYIANKDSDEIVVRPVDPATGIPGAVVGRTATPSPVCVLPV